MRSRQDILFNFGLFIPKFGCHGNSLGSLEILDSIFEIAVPENPTMHAKFMSISCTEHCSENRSYAYLNVWRIFTIAGIGNFLDFCEK